MKSCDKRPLRHRRASPYIGCMRRMRESAPSFPRRQKPRIPAPCPRHSSEGWNPSEGEGSDDRKCNQMQLNATEIKGSPLLRTPDEANQGHSEVRLPWRVRVSGVPTKATVASFSASPLGVNEANQGQMGPRSNPPPSFPRRRGTSHPCPLQIPSPSGDLCITPAQPSPQGKGIFRSFLP